jgi:hypothetical protein
MRPDPETLRELMSYDPETGKLYWRFRDRSYFPDDGTWKMWNTQFADKEAFTSKADNGYYRGAVLGHHDKTHRVGWAIHYGKWPDSHMDHVNGDRSDNRLCNLRVVTPAENCRNMRRSSSNTSGVPGVHWNGKIKKWVAAVKDADGNQIHLGCFTALQDAAFVRKVSELMHGYHPNNGRG